MGKKIFAAPKRGGVDLADLLQLRSPSTPASTLVVRPITHTYAHTHFAEQSFFHTWTLCAWLQMRGAVSLSPGSYKLTQSHVKEFSVENVQQCVKAMGKQTPLHASIWHGIWGDCLACCLLDPFYLQCKALCWKKKMFCQKQDHKWLISHIGSDNHLIFMLSQEQNWQFVSVHYGCVIVSSFWNYQKNLRIRNYVNNIELSQGTFYNYWKH